MEATLQWRPSIGKVLLVIAAVSLAGGCGATGAAGELRVGILHADTGRPVVDGIGYRVVSFDVDAVQSSGDLGAAFRSRVVGGIDARGHPLPVRLTPKDSLVVEHPHYRTAIVSIDGDEAMVRFASAGTLAVGDVLEYPASVPPRTDGRLPLSQGRLIWLRLHRAKDDL